jgi:protein-disulfide isomerase
LHSRRVRSDYEGGVRSGVNKTPTLFINGRRYEGPVEADAVVAAAQAASA